MNRAAQVPRRFSRACAGGLCRTLPLLAAFLVTMLIAAEPEAPRPVWHSLPDMPGGVGYAGMYAGVSHGVLLAAGGANFLPSADGGVPRKTWHDDVHVLRPGASRWEPAGKLPRRGAYGVSATWNDRVICVAGGAEEGAFGEAWIMEWTPQGLRIESLPDLPAGAEMAAGAVLAGVLHVVIDGPSALRLFSLDLNVPAELRSWLERPGPAGARPRKLAVAGAADGRFFLFGGLAAGEDGSSFHLRDAYAFTPAGDWRRLADLPRGVAGAAGPAMRLAQDRLAVWGGLDAPWAELSRVMRYFESGFLIYDPAADRWTTLPQGVVAEDRAMFPSRLTASVVPWLGGHAILGGETEPRVRTVTTPWVEFR